MRYGAFSRSKLATYPVSVIWQCVSFWLERNHGDSQGTRYCGAESDGVCRLCSCDLAWLYLWQRVERNNGLLSKIDKLPEKDGLDALRAEVGNVRVSGLNAEQWIRSRIHLYYFLSFAILWLLVSVLFAISAFKNANAITSDPTTSKTLTIRGSVRDKTTNLSVKNATVSLVGRADVPSVFTDSNR